MADARVVRFDEVRWRPFDMPRGSMQVQLAPLRLGDDGAVTTLVRFPSGWRRDGSGHYGAGEELVVLEGGFEMSGVAYDAPAWGFVPAGAPRARTRVREGGALAVARFDGDPAWVDGKDTDGTGVATRPLGGFEQTSPLGARGTLLRAGTGEASWWVERIDARPAERGLELIDPGARIWAWIPRGETPPALGPCVCRIIEEA